MATAKKAAPKKAAPKKAAPKKAAVKRVEPLVDLYEDEEIEISKEEKKKASLFILKSTVHDDLYIHHSPRLNDKDHDFRLQKGKDDAEVFNQKQLDEYLRTLPKANGLKIIIVG